MPDRNLVSDEQAETNRTVGFPGAYTFNARIAADYPDGARCQTFAAVRLGDHAHIEVTTGRAIDPGPYRHGEREAVGRGVAGRLVMAWADWLLLRGILAAHPGIHIAEVEKPSRGQLEYHCGPSPRATEGGTMSDVSLIPVGDRVIVEVLDPDPVSVGGVVIPDNAQDRPQRARVVAVGPGGRNDRGYTVPVDVEAGDEVVFGRFGGVEVSDRAGREFLILRETDLLAKVPGP